MLSDNAKSKSRPSAAELGPGCGFSHLILVAASALNIDAGLAHAGTYPNALKSGTSLTFREELLIAEA